MTRIDDGKESRVEFRDILRRAFKTGAFALMLAAERTRCARNSPRRRNRRSR